MLRRLASALRLLDPLVFCNLWIAAAAALLCAAASRALGIPPQLPVVGLAAAGTLAVYTADRLRDLSRDRATAPARSAFVDRHRGALAILGGAALLAAVACGVAIGPRAVLLAGGVLLLALAHPWLKAIAFAKSTYLAASWLAVCVGLPRVAGPGGEDLVWALAVLAGPLAGNAIASSLRDAEGGAARLGRPAALALARVGAAIGLALALLAPPAIRPLGAVAAATLLALVFYRDDERYGLVILDGALGVGAGVALAL